jgi:2-polyprenyl-3-methyl-5-hydroxy-6-metoxy-1,4-benzoquinol methylase
MMGSSQNMTVLVPKVGTVEAFNRTVIWARQRYRPARLLGLVDLDYAFAVDRSQLDELLVTQPGDIRVERLVSDVVERIEKAAPGVLVVPCSDPGYNRRQSFLILAKRFGIPEVTLFAGPDRHKTLRGGGIGRFLWRKFLSEGLRSMFKGQDAPAVEPTPGHVEPYDPLASRVVYKGVGNSGLLSGNVGYLENDPPLNLASLEPTSRFRVVLLGGSSVYGIGLEQNSQTISSKMNVLLRERHGIDAEVLNCGVTGGWSRSECSLLLFKLLYSQPDAVISFSGWNDFATTTCVKHRYGPGSEILNWTFHDYYYYLGYQAPWEIGNYHTAFADKEFVRRYYPFLDRDAFPQSGPGLRDDLWANNLGLMALACQDRGCAFFGALQPHSLYQPVVPDDRYVSWLRGNWKYYFLKDMDEQELWGLYKTEIERFYAHCRSKLDELGRRYPEARFADFSHIFRDEPESCFVNVIHYNDRGTTVIAERLVELLEQRGLLADAPRASATPRPASAPAPAAEPVAREEVTRKVLSFYESLPFNYYDSAEEQADMVCGGAILEHYAVLRPLLERPGMSVLDVGCGTGQLANTLALACGCRVLGVDLNPVAVERARDVARILGLGTQFQVGNLFTFDPGQRFGLVTSVGVLHHTADCLGAMRRIIRDCLVEDGYLFVGLYHAYGRKPFLDHFASLRAEGLSEAELFAEYAALHKDYANYDKLNSWFRDQVLHPHETQHTLEECWALLEEEGMELVSTSINRFGGVGNSAELFALERKLEETGRQWLENREYFPGFFVFLARRKPVR